MLNCVNLIPAAGTERLSLCGLLQKKNNSHLQDALDNILSLMIHKTNPDDHDESSTSTGVHLWIQGCKIEIRYVLARIFKN